MSFWQCIRQKLDLLVLLQQWQILPYIILELHLHNLFLTSRDVLLRINYKQRNVNLTPCPSFEACDLQKTHGLPHCTWYLNKWSTVTLGWLKCFGRTHHPRQGSRGPHIDDFSQGLRRKQVFSNIDLVRAYNQVPVAAEDIYKTAVTTLFGLFEFSFMPFILRNVAKHFSVSGMIFYVDWISVRFL